MKKIFLLGFLFLFLTSCSSESQEVTPQTGLVSYDQKEFLISLPEKWNIITDENKLPTPKIGEVTLAATSSELKFGFSNNIIVLSQDISKPVTSNDFSLLNNVGASKEYKEYLKLDSQKLTFEDKDTTTAYVFEAKYNTETPKLKFMQFGKVCGQKRAHLITIAVAQDTKDISPYLEFAKTFACK